MYPTNSIYLLGLKLLKINESVSFFINSQTNMHFNVTEIPVVVK